MTRPFARRSLLPALLAAAGAAAGPAHASEGGASLYLLGSGGPEAAIAPPVEGVFFDNTFYYYDGTTDVSRQFVLGGKVVAGLDAEIVADFATVLWVPSTDVAGGTLSLGAALPVGRPSVKVDAVLTGPGGGQLAVAREDSAFIVGDPLATAMMSWKAGGNWYVHAEATVNIPVGEYREDQLANLAFHRWATDVSFATSWHDPEAGWDVSAKAGFTLNGTNHYTDYDTGTEFHLEGAVERIFSPQFSAGLQAYHFQQVSGDSGSGAVLGPYKGRVTGVGATAAYNFELGKTPVTARLRVFEEFGAKNRLEGTSVFFSLTLPLWMNLPAGAGG